MLQVGLAAASSAAVLYNYNRASWMSDTRRKSGRRVHVHGVLLNQASMFRDDIKQLCLAATTRQRNYVTVATIFLGMTGTCYVNKPLPRETPVYLSTAYRQCVGSAFFYLVLSVLCGMAAIHMATRCQRDMLLTRVRLPVDDLLKSLRASAFSESIEAFEHQGPARMLRIPGVSFVRNLAFAQWPVLDPGLKQNRRLGPRVSYQEQDEPSDALEDLGSTYHEAAFATDALRTMEERQAQHLEVFFKHEREWILCGQQTILLAALGISHLLEAYGIISLAQYYTGDVWASWTVEVKVTMINLVTALACGRYLEFSWNVLLAESVFILVGPLASSAAVLPSSMRGTCISAMYLCRLVINAIALYKLHGLSPVSGPPPKSMFHPAVDGRGCLPEPEEEEPSSSDEFRGSFVPRRARSGELSGTSGNTHALVASSSVVMVSWLLCFLWSVHHQITGAIAPLVSPHLA